MSLVNLFSIARALFVFKCSALISLDSNSSEAYSTHAIMERRWFSLFCILAVFYWFANGEKARFDNYRLYELNIDNEKQLDALQQIDSFPDGYLFWESPLVLNEIAEIMVPPHKFGEFSELIGNHNITSKLKIKNIQTYVQVVLCVECCSNGRKVQIFKLKQKPVCV